MDLLVKFHYNVDNHTRDKDDGSREEYVRVGNQHEKIVVSWRSASNNYL